MSKSFKIQDTADRLLGICEDWTVKDIKEHLLWLIKNPDEIADGYYKDVFTLDNVGWIMLWVEEYKK